MALPELAGLRRSLLGWLTEADAAGLDEDGIVALVTSALRDFRGVRGVVPPGQQSRDRRGGSGGRRGTAGTDTKGVA